MLLGELLRSLRDEKQAELALAATGDLLLMAEVESIRTDFGESTGEYVSSAVQRFAQSAADEDWQQLMTLIERADDTAIVCVATMLRWALCADKAEAEHAAASGSHYCLGHANGRHL